MQYLLTEDEFKVYEKGKALLLQQGGNNQLLIDLRAKIIELGEFKCYHELSNEALVHGEPIDEGYCDPCPLSFAENDGKGQKYRMCPHERKLYSK